MKKAVMYGAGNIGRGFIGQLFSQSGYQVVFLDINPLIVDRLNSDGRYPIRIIKDSSETEIYVEGVRSVNGAELEKAAAEIAAADIMATAVGVNVLPRIVKTIAAGLKKRWAGGNFHPLNIIICENLMDANRFLERLIKLELEERERGYFDETVGLVEASIGRMVPAVTPEMQSHNPLLIRVEEYCELPVDRDAFKGDIPQIVNMKPFSPFAFHIQRKLYMHNMAHALISYLGFHQGRGFIWEACKDPTVKLIGLRALMEASGALSLEHGVPLLELYEFSEDLMYRFGNRLLGDTVERVGKDPVRKLSENDRLVGSSTLCLKHGIMPVYISLGIAAGFLFAPAGDEMALKVQSVLRDRRIEETVEEFCGIDSSSPLFGSVVEFYGMLSGVRGLEEVFERAEKMKRTASLPLLAS